MAQLPGYETQSWPTKSHPQQRRECTKLHPKATCHLKKQEKLAEIHAYAHAGTIKCCEQITTWSLKKDLVHFGFKPFPAAVRFRQWSEWKIPAWSEGGCRRRPKKFSWQLQKVDRKNRKFEFTYHLDW